MENIIDIVKSTIEAPSCCAELKAAGQAYLDAAGTDKEAEAAKNLVAEATEDVTPIDGLIAFAGSDAGKGYFGADVAAQLESHAKEIKAKGAKYCDCAACTGAVRIAELLG